ncbi:heat-shock protein [Achromatium sp. WMS2]|nr:heat-shock protein [Achromatium sp. WMS2]
MSQKTELTSEQSKELTKHWEDGQFTLRPAVNIFENAKGITLEADMPGVASDGLEIHVDKGRLLVEGKAKLTTAENMEPLYADIRSNRYQCSFALGQELDIGNVNAALKDGVLTLTIPKRAELQPRKIQVQVG